MGYPHERLELLTIITSAFLGISVSSKGKFRERLQSLRHNKQPTTIHLKAFCTYV